MNCKGVIFDLAIKSGGNFSNINDFCDRVIELYDLKTYTDIIRVVNEKKISEYDEITGKNVLDIIVSHDVNLFDMDSYSFQDVKNSSAFMKDHINRVIALYKDIGLNIDYTDIDVYFCDVFPKPFDKNQGVALAPDSYDEEKYGMKKGIYFLNSNVSYYQSRLLIAHEILHHICAKQNPELLARGLEEGLCELLGAYMINSKLFDNPIPENYIKYRRFKYDNPNQKFRIYTDYMRLAFLLLKQVGISGVVNIINDGRKKIKEVESALIKGEDVYSLSSSCSDLPLDLLESLDKLLLGTIENEVISPLAYYIINNYDGEKTVSLFARRHNILLSDCRRAFQEIQSRIYGCVLEDDSIEFSDIKQLDRNSNVLYECKGERNGWKA